MTRPMSLRGNASTKSTCRGTRNSVTSSRCADRRRRGRRPDSRSCRRCRAARPAGPARHRRSTSSPARVWTEACPGPAGLPEPPTQPARASSACAHPSRGRPRRTPRRRSPWSASRRRSSSALTGGDARVQRDDLRTDPARAEDGEKLVEAVAGDDPDAVLGADFSLQQDLGGARSERATSAAYVRLSPVSASMTASRWGSRAAACRTWPARPIRQGEIALAWRHVASPRLGLTTPRRARSATCPGDSSSTPPPLEDG
jgi:hypothetical protein